MSPEHERLLALWRARWPQREPGLVAFAVLRDGAEADADELRLWLAQSLPTNLLPTRVVVVDDLPRTPAGKIDRRALQLPIESTAPRREAIAPRNAVETRLAELFAQVLGVPPRSVDDDFFAHLGGHSLLATQLASLIRTEWAVVFELRTVFECPTVEGLAAYIDRALRDGNAPARKPIARRAETGSGAG